MFISIINTKHLTHLMSVVMVGIAIFAGSLLAGNAAEKVSKRALKEMIAGAKTAADHKAIADHYYAEASRARAKAKEHDQMAAWYW